MSGLGAPELLDMRMLRDGARRPIPWEGLAQGGDPVTREAVGEEWLERMKQEHLAVGAFSGIAGELAADGCDATVLWLVTRAAADEVRHAEVCRRVAASLLGDERVPRRLRGLPRVPTHEGKSSGARVLLHVVEMCCLSETVTGVWFTEALARTEHPTMRAVLESLLEDEIDHGRVGWAYLASRMQEGRAKSVAAALPEMLDRVFGRSFDKPREDAGDGAAREALGTLSSATGKAVLERALRDVVLPGFEAIGIDLAPSHRRIKARGWLQAGVVEPTAAAAEAG